MTMLDSQSFPQRVIEIVGIGLKAFGKAFAASARQGRKSRSSLVHMLSPRAFLFNTAQIFSTSPS